MKLIIGGHWTNAPEGWTALTEQECDIRGVLPYQDGTVDVIFTEHVQEHVTLIDNIYFAKQVLRVLKPNGIFRMCMPCIDKMIRFKNDELGKHYSDVQTKHYYQNEDAALKELGLEGIREEPIMFMFDSLFKGHFHKMLWTSKLMKKVLEKVGFSKVNIVEPGNSLFEEKTELERIVRGVDVDILRDKFNMRFFDPESLVIEAKK